jgi:hypothetical protein
MGTTIYVAIGLDPMAQNPTATVAACGRQSLNGALKAIKAMRGSSHNDLKGLVIVIATGFAPSHGYTPLYMRLFTEILLVAPAHREGQDEEQECLGERRGCLLSA